MLFRTLPSTRPKSFSSYFFYLLARFFIFIFYIQCNFFNCIPTPFCETRNLTPNSFWRIIFLFFFIFFNSLKIRFYPIQHLIFLMCIYYYLLLLNFGFLFSFSVSVFINFNLPFYESSLFFVRHFVIFFLGYPHKNLH